MRDNAIGISEERLPRIFDLTGYGAERARRTGRDAGFGLHLVKPVDADELEAALLPGAAEACFTA